MKKGILIIIIILLGANIQAQTKRRIIPVNDTTVYEYAIEKQIAQFKGGTTAFFKFVGRNLKWPQNGSDVSGKVLISFIVEKDGILTHFKVERGIESAFDAEALRVVKRSPKWVPAKINGKRIRSRYIVPISFTITDNG
ncbi:protein TonB [Mucilaginibacter pineti]|uniref:Protein TonB n=1 Tax=Mucilaginibacter pineti TaxID=1391627 RepID=A0A1G6TW22_9SPHI|nr:TonB family protein [Mucilaginibacter pineti]SDD32505.1 protein TonB [Mucilaginibacter pineti]